MRRLLVTVSLLFCLLGVTKAQNTIPVSFVLPPRFYGLGHTPAWTVTGDFNSDGKTDIVAQSIDDFFTQSFSLLLGNGDGNFQSPITLPIQGCGGATADFNRDGNLDLVFGNCGNSNTLTVLLGEGNGMFQTPMIIPFDANAFPIVGDFNSDGRPDIAVIGVFSALDHVTILLGNGNGTFQNGVQYATGIIPYDIAIGDLNGDGLPDIVTTDSSTVSILRGNLNGTFQAPELVNLSDDWPLGYIVAIGDFNGDGKADIAVLGQHLRILPGDGSGIFSAPQPGGYVDVGDLGGLNWLIGTDFNGDSIPDLAAGYLNGDVNIFLGVGDGTFVEPDSSINMALRPCCDFTGSDTFNDGFFADGNLVFAGSSIATGDFNGDGKTDFVGVGHGRYDGPQNVTIFINNTPTLNTPTGTDVSARPVDTTTTSNPVTLSFSDLTQSGMTTLTTSSTGTAPPSGFQLGTHATYYNLSTTATFSGTVSVCVTYPASYSDPSNLHLFHYESGGWVDITTSLDTAHNLICGNTTSLSPFVVAQATFAAQVQDPINVDGSSVFNAKKGVVPVKFALTLGNVPTCTLPTASIVLVRTSGSTPGTIDESVYENSSDNGSYFRVSGCQYVYNVASKALGAGTYKVQIVLGTSVVGSGTFGLK
jgi:hypothetical protein